MKVNCLKCLQDNYIWTIDSNSHCLIVDPGQAQPVETYLQKNKIRSITILVTHHHLDHTGGILDLVKKYPETVVYGPKNWLKNELPNYKIVNETHPVSIPEIGTEFTVLPTPGHTHDATCYYNHQIAFTGDTLFCAGIGRVFEGTMEQMYESISRLNRTITAQTKIYCGHEYTLKNLNFAQQVLPNNLDIKALISISQTHINQQQPTLPTTLEIERKVNPFIHAVHNPEASFTFPDNTSTPTPFEKFQHLRALKDVF